MGEKWEDFCVPGSAWSEWKYAAVILFHEEMAKERKMGMEEYLQEFYQKIRGESGEKIRFYVGSPAHGIGQLPDSRRTAALVRSLCGFDDAGIFWYEKEQEKLHSQEVLICRETLDQLIRAARENEKEEISRQVKELYRQMKAADIYGSMADMNFQYLLFGLLHLAAQQEEGQEKILALVADNYSDMDMIRGSSSQLETFVLKYAQDLAELRKKGAFGVLGEVEKEIEVRYAENLTLKEMSQKFYVNSAYLGQMFKKKHGISFKEFLNRYRIERASELLLGTDKKIYEIAQETGYHDLDYFINRFIAEKGCTPSRFRKRAKEEE